MGTKSPTHVEAEPLPIDKLHSQKTSALRLTSSDESATNPNQSDGFSRHILSEQDRYKLLSVKDLMSNSSDLLEGFVKAGHWDDVLHAIQQNPDELNREFLQEICRSGPSFKVIDHISQTSYHELLRERTAGKGQCVLHALCYFGAPKDVINVIVSNYTDTLSAMDSSRCTPLDYAMSTNWIHAKEEQKIVISYEGLSYNIH
jgi:hypothetical protein